MKRAKLIIWIAAVLLMILPATLLAQPQEQTEGMKEGIVPQAGKINFGNLSIIPGVELQGVYDDNIYRKSGKDYPSAQTTQEQKKVSDWIGHIKPGLLLNYVIPARGYLNLGYQGDFAFYNSNSNDNWKNNTGNLGFIYEAPGGLILGINDFYANVEDPFGSANQYAIGQVKKRWTNDLGTKIGYNIASNFRTFLYYNNFVQKYDSIVDFTQNYTDNVFAVGAEARFLPKTWGFLRYSYGQRTFNTLGPTQLTDANNANSKFSTVSAGVTWDPGSKLSGEFNIGYQWLTFDHPRTDDGLYRQDQSTWVAQTVVRFAATETTTLGLTVNRAIRPTSAISNELFTDTGIGLSVNQRLLLKLALTAGISYSKNEYNLTPAGFVGGSRTDDNFLANIGLIYQIRDWMGVTVGYNYNQKKSNYEIYEFVDNQFVASLKVFY
jgi:hypothetical protein